jgi:chloramphenicol-sensitive protein RarD
MGPNPDALLEVSAPNHRIGGENGRNGGCGRFDMNTGFLYAVGAYALWGILPIYWKFLQTVPALEIICHRMAWSALSVGAVLGVRRHWGWLRDALSSPVTLATFLGTGGLLAVNWLIYVWAVNAGNIVETSLGYFINPLLTVVLGVIFLRERPRRWQWAAISIAAVGILYLTFQYGVFPWIALTLAFTFGFYGLLRKTASLTAIEGLSLETAFFLLPAFAYIVHLELAGDGSFGHEGASITILLGMTGITTILPLFLYVSAARRITFTNLGILHYIAPSMQFLIGVFVYGELFTRSRLIGFVIIWLALVIYTIDGIRWRRKRSRLAARMKPVDASESDPLTLASP